MPRFAVTLWRDVSELADLRRRLFRLGEYRDNDGRQDAVNQILAWRARRTDIPLGLDSTVNIIDVVLQEEKNKISHHSLRLLYASAISRFVTGFCDTNQNISRKVEMSETAKTYDLPLLFVETRHSIVHREMPSLMILKHVAQESLDWLWHWYWARLDPIIATSPNGSVTHETRQQVRDDLQGVLKSFLHDRRTELSGKMQLHKASDIAKIASPAAQVATMATVKACKGKSEYLEILADILVFAKTIIPNTKKADTGMRGAFLLWDPLLERIAIHQWTFLRTLALRMMEFLNNNSAFLSITADPARGAICKWLEHILVSEPWTKCLQRVNAKLPNEVMGMCFVSPTPWHLKLAEALLDESKKRNDRKFEATWRPVYEASLDESEDAMDASNGPVIEDSSSAPQITSIGRPRELDSTASNETRDEEASSVEMSITKGSQALIHPRSRQDLHSKAANNEDVGMDVADGPPAGWKKWEGMWKRTPIGVLPEDFTPFVGEDGAESGVARVTV